MTQWTIRLPDELAVQVVEASKASGYTSPRAFVREAIRKQLNRLGPTEDAEARIAASLDRLVAELRRLGTSQQAQFALTDGLARAFFTCVAEPPRELIDQARSRAMLRYDRFLKTVALSMSGTSRATLSELLSHDE